MKERYLILLAAIAIVAVAYFYTSNMMINDRISDIARHDRAIRRDQERLNSAKVMDEQLSQVSKVIENTLGEARIFSAEEINSFVRKFAELADKHKIAVFSSMPRPVHSSGNLVEHQFSMDIMCTYVQLGRLLTELEAMDYIIKVNTIDTKPIRGEDVGLIVDDERITQYRVLIELSAFKILKEA